MGRPSAVRRCSTRGGTTAHARRSTKPSRSNVRSISSLNGDGVAAIAADDLAVRRLNR
ncbi:hypothetical protein [Amycolatopsis saalfeldensis]|uniref:hypothetical protein n=1 Tax=Amycolatopsis saalfeldensis TaxID=394193 RepID=UPI001FE8E8E7|nr:hypothetical protein [Amycolatopsis saalfeldensis]